MTSKRIEKEELQPKTKPCHQKLPEGRLGIKQNN
jgi:hypothetical protein